MLAALSPWGRDGEGFWNEDGIALGWRQTMLHAEDHADIQPLTGGEDRFRLVFDGRLDNREDLAAALSLQPSAAAEWPDSRLVLAAWEKWGDDCPRYLLGDLTFAVWDRQTRSLFLARDHTGGRPLVWCRRNGFFAFATSAVGLFAHPDIPRRISRHDITQFLGLQMPEPDATLYENVRRLPGGHAMWVTENSERMWAYWRLEDTPDIRFGRDDDYVEALRERYERTIRAQLRTIHPVGTHLSSGLDSASVTAFSASLLTKESRRLTAFTAVPSEGWSAPRDPLGYIADEGHYAALVAARYPNVEHVRIHGPGELDFSVYDQVAAAFGAPISSVLNGGWWDRLHRAARARGVRVMLLGASGNVTISFDGSGLLTQLLQQGRLADFVREWRAARARGRSHLGLLFSAAAPLIPPSLLRTLLAARGNSTDHILRNSYRRAGPNRARTYRDKLSALCRQGKEYGTGHGLAVWDIDLRDPTRAKQIIEYCYAIPPEQFYFRGEPRRLMRRLLNGVLPDEVLNLQKRGLQAADWTVLADNSRDRIVREVGDIRNRGMLADSLDYERMWQFAHQPVAQLRRSQFQSLLSGILTERFVRGEGHEP